MYPFYTIDTDDLLTENYITKLNKILTVTLVSRHNCEICADTLLVAYEKNMTTVRILHNISTIYLPPNLIHS